MWMRIMPARALPIAIYSGPLLWMDTSTEQIYLSFINLFGSQGIFKPEQIASATLTLDAAQVDEPGKITAYFLHGATLETTTWFDKSDYDAEVSSSPVNVDEEGSYTWDVTDIIKESGRDLHGRVRLLHRIGGGR